MAAARNSRGVEDVRRDLEQERDRLASAADSLRENIEEATDITGKMRTQLPLVAGGALAAGFVVAGGIGATVRLIFRRGREGNTIARLGPIRFVDDSREIWPF
jgi:ornithine cyclodeaminase/alanine dehydrogenase-like protein (mu-crystallin family)